VEYLAGPTPDSTLILLTLSLANRALTFMGDGDGYEAHYEVAADLRREGAAVRHTETRQTVRVASFRETGRTDESVVFQQYLCSPPGTYSFTLSVRDEGSAHRGQHTMELTVPRFGTGSVSSPVVVYEASRRRSADTVPELIANPRGTAFFGRDSVVQVYLEAYGLGPRTPVTLTVLGDNHAELWQDTLTFGAAGGHVQAQIATIPVPEVGVGRLTLVASPPGGAPMRTPFFVTFGEEWAITSFEEMLSYLRYYASAERLQMLRDAAPRERAAAWLAFYRETDPDPRTPEHEGLRDYFRRIQFANARFTEEGGPGWLTDRGRVYITLGDPDQILEQGESSMSQRGRVQVWAYRQYRLQLAFIDQTGFGRWHLTPSSEIEFNAVAMRERR
jgi:GWxTD domain-containing protein